MRMVNIAVLAMMVLSSVIQATEPYRNRALPFFLRNFCSVMQRPDHPAVCEEIDHDPVGIYEFMMSLHKTGKAPANFHQEHFMLDYALQADQPALKKLVDFALIKKWNHEQ